MLILYVLVCIRAKPFDMVHDFFVCADEYSIWVTSVAKGNRRFPLPVVYIACWDGDCEHHGEFSQGQTNFKNMSTLASSYVNHGR